MDTHTQDVRIAQWTSIVQECNTSGMTKKQWCKDNDVDEKQLYYWQRRIRRMIIQTASGNAESTGVKFAELPMVKKEAVQTSFETPSTTYSVPQLRLNKGSLSIEISNLSEKELLAFTKELLRDA